MKLTIYADTTDELRSQVAHLARFCGLSVGDVPEPADLTVGTALTRIEPTPAPRPRGRPPKAPVDTTSAAGAPPPAAPAPAEPAATMLPLCSTHAPLYPAIRAIPAEPAACVKCAAAAEGPKSTTTGKRMTLDEVKAVAQELGESRADGWDTCYKILESLGAESLTGAVDPDTKVATKALDPEKYEEFARQFTAAMTPASPAAPKPARRSL